MTVSKIKIILGLIFINGIYLFLLCNFLKQSFINLDEFNSIEGEISEVGIDTILWKSSKSIFPQSLTVYYFKLNNSPPVYYFPYLEKYDKAFNQLNKNLPVSVYFENKRTIKRNNIQEIIQLEENNKVIISKKDQEELSRILAIVILVAIIVTNWVSYFKLKKAKI